jgi:hypothetical protein
MKRIWMLGVATGVLILVIGATRLRSRGASPAPEGVPASGQAAHRDAAPPEPDPAVPEQPIDGMSALSKVEMETMTTPAREAEAVARLKAWPEFYETVRSLELKPEEYQRILVGRIAQQLELDDDDHHALSRLLQQEQDAVTAAAVQAFGSGQALRDHARVQGAAARAFWTELGRLRGEARGVFQAQYEARFNKADMELINEHLRNSTLRITTSFEGASMKVAVWGIGK